MSGASEDLQTKWYGVPARLGQLAYMVACGNWTEACHPPANRHTRSQSVTRLSLSSGKPILLVMGKVIQFPVAHGRRRQRQAALTFEAFGELQALERAQLKLFAVCALGATLIMGALQLFSL